MDNDSADPTILKSKLSAIKNEYDSQQEPSTRSR